MLYRKYRPRLIGVEAAQERDLLLRIEAAGVPTYRQSIPAIFAELRRCRRYEHNMAVLVTGLAAASEADRRANPSAAATDLMLYLALGSMLQDVTRESDIVTYAALEHVYAVFLPESDELAALRTARRVARVFHERTTARMRAGVAVFPSHGLIVDALFDHALNSYERATPVSLDDDEPQEHGDAWQNVRSAR